MYPYHNRIKQRIGCGELIGFYFTDSYRKIGKCLLLEFSTSPFVRPIRPHKYNEYLPLLYQVFGKETVIKSLPREDGGQMLQ